MGSSADATFFYGYVWEGEGAGFYRTKDEDGWWEWDEENGDLDENGESAKVLRPGNEYSFIPEILLAEEGLVSPWDSYVYPEDRIDWEPSREAFAEAHAAEIECWEAAKAALEARMGLDVVTDGYHGHYDFSAPFICIKESKKRVTWGDAEEITSIEVAPDWDEKLDLYLASFETDSRFARGPGWFMVCDYG